jgi:hypothetical protein
MLSSLARKVAGAMSIRLSLRPVFRGRLQGQSSGKFCRENADVCPIVIASAAKQSMPQQAEMWIAHMGNVCVKD